MRDGLMEVSEEQGPFDGILGFSQGAILAGLLCGLIAYTEGTLDRSSIFKFDFAIMVGGSSLATRTSLSCRNTAKGTASHRSTWMGVPTASSHPTSAELSDVFKNPTVTVH
jgi:hypothetical protein